jgi:ADP-ribosylglycohydrolase
VAWDISDPAQLLADELTLRTEAGYDVARAEPQVRAALLHGDPAAIARADDHLRRTVLRADWPYVEPSSLAQIESSLEPAFPPPCDLDDAHLRDRLLAAWLGRCAGCNLGKPVEGWSRSRIRSYLDRADAYPIEDYVPALDEMSGEWLLNDCWPETTRGNVAYMARDDDIDYTILALHLLEDRGFGIGPDDVGAEWLDHLPYTQIYTAERLAYKNLVRGLAPPATADVRNPYREWIGAQIRADLYGYVFPGDPRSASSLAFQDASLSHTENGIYGAMWVAALIATVFTVPDEREALGTSITWIPPRSRLAEALKDVMDMHARGIEWESARDGIEERYGHYSKVHTINNAALVAAALLWGAGDFTKTIGLAVQGGWDTDCNGATAGSVFGAMHGTHLLPDHWIEPLHDLIRSSIIGFDRSTPSDLAERTLRLARSEGRPKVAAMFGDT